MRNKLGVFTAVGITFVLHSVLQWYCWALADGIGRRYPLPFAILSFPALWLVPRSVVSFEAWMALNSAIWAGCAGLLVMWLQHRKRNHSSVPGE